MRKYCLFGRADKKPTNYYRKALDILNKKITLLGHCIYMRGREGSYTTWDS